MREATRGESLARARIAALQPDVQRARVRLGRPAALAVLATDEPASRRFVEIKRATFAAAGLTLHPRWFGADASTPDVRRSVQVDSTAGDVDGIFLQFPLPAHIDAQSCADAIAPERDIDASGAHALGRLLAGHARYVPAAPASVLDLLTDSLGSLLQRSLLIVGEDGVTERTVLLLCAAQGAICGITRPLDAALPDQLAGVDAVVITGAIPPRDALRHLRAGAVLIDAGYFLPPRPADWLPERVQAHLGAFHAQYRNIGPLTVSHLMQATLRAALAR